MRRTTLILVLLLCALLASAQAVDTSMLDFSKIDWSGARVTIAGPDKLYVRSVTYEGESVSVLLTYDGEYGATISGPYLDSDVKGKLIADSYEAAYATVEPVGAYSLKISPVIIEDQAYAGVLDWAPGTNKLALSSWSAADMPTTYAALVLSAAKATAEADKLSNQLFAANASADKAAKDAASAKAEADAAKAAVATAKAEAASAKADADNAKKEAAAAKSTSSDLQSQVSRLKAAAAGAAVSMEIPALDPSKLDFSKARAAIAGPDKVYIRNVIYDGEAVSVLLTYDGEYGAVLSGPYFTEDKLLQDDYEVAYLTIEPAGAWSLKLSPIIVEGEAFAGVFAWEQGTNKITLETYEPVDMPKTYEYLVELSGQDAKQINNFRNQIVAFQANEAALKKQAADAKTAADNATAAVDKANKEAADLKAQLAAEKAKTASLTARLATAQAGGAPAAAALPKIDLAKLDLTKAKASIAGPNTVYIRSIMYDGEEVSVTMNYDGAMGATLSGPYFAGDKLLQDSDEVSYVVFEPVGPTSIKLAPVMIEGEAYYGIFDWAPDTNAITLVAYDTMAKPATYEEYQLAATKAKAELDKAKADLAAAKADADKAKADLAAAKMAAPAKAAAVVPEGALIVTFPAKELTKTALASFDTGKGAFGTWSSKAGVLTQTNADLKFAKYTVPVTQKESEILYELTGKAKLNNWIGYGLHFLASGDKKANGWGFGSSYLVWVTRDTSYYQTGATYVQLYQSKDDATMNQLSSVNIPESIADELKVQVLYNADLKTITVAVNDIVRFVTVVDKPITSGDKVAVRTLGGPVQITDLKVKGR